MKFGIFHELATPRPFTAENERKVLMNALEQVRVADEVGFDTVWAVEHHFLEGYSHSSAPELFLTACAMQTERIRIGHGAVVCVREMNHPIRVAERAATLDLLSGGRLEFGTARSSTWTELGGFEADPDRTKQDWDEFVRAIPGMWTQERFSWQGSCFSMPERAVLPKPLQKPHPPMWVTVTSPGTELDAAERGLGCLGVATASLAEQERRTKEYKRRIQLCDPAGHVNDRVATLNFMYCHEDLAVAAKRGMSFLGTFGLLNSHLLFTREAWPTTAYQSLGGVSAPAASKGGGNPGAAYGVPDGVAIEIRPDRAGDQAMGVGRRRPGQLPGQRLRDPAPEQVLESLRLFAREVMPAFREEGGGRA
ncbi:MAG: LLM class flavin-dependent oxidoreductase [Myxococcota bacterium]